MGMTYFANDGSYGDAEGLLIIDTSSWSESDWDKVDSVSDSVRDAVAMQIDVKRSGEK